MRPEDALGGMLRAKQIVVVGDPKQLPPTDFFMRSADETSLDDEFEDVDADQRDLIQEELRRLCADDQTPANAASRTADAAWVLHRAR